MTFNSTGVPSKYIFSSRTNAAQKFFPQSTSLSQQTPFHVNPGPGGGGTEAPLPGPILVWAAVGAEGGVPLMFSCFPMLPDCLRRWTSASLLPLGGRPTFRHSTCSWLMLSEAQGSATGFWGGSLRVGGAGFLALEAFNLAVIAALLPEESRPLARQAFFKSSRDMDARGQDGSTGSGMTVQGGGGGALA